MSKLTTEKRQISKKKDEFDTFGKFIVLELQAIKQNGNNYTVRLVKQKIQHVLMEMWDTIDGLSLCLLSTISNDASNSDPCTWSISSCRDPHSLLMPPAEANIIIQL